MIHSTFRLTPGVGPYLEARLWEAGIRSWAEFPHVPGAALSPPLHARIRAAIAREQGTMPASEDDEPALGLILRLWPEMPAWARYRRSSFYQRNPVTSIVVAGLLVGTFQFGLLGILGGLVALGLVACSIALYLWTKAGNARDDGEMLEDWNRKVQTLASMIERKLEEL